MLFFEIGIIVCVYFEGLYFTNVIEFCYWRYSIRFIVLSVCGFIVLGVVLFGIERNSIDMQCMCILVACSFL